MTRIVDAQSVGARPGQLLAVRSVNANLVAPNIIRELILRDEDAKEEGADRGNDVLGHGWLPWKGGVNAASAGDSVVVGVNRFKNENEEKLVGEVFGTSASASAASRRSATGRPRRRASTTATMPPPTPQSAPNSPAASPVSNRLLPA